jgi:DNA-binding transcriptional ArsR family regulator
MVAKAMEALRRLGKGTRGIEDSVSYAVGHRIRIEILAALHEGPETPDGLAKIVRRPLSTVTHHVEELLKDGSIEIAHSVKVRGNIVQHYYRVIELPEFSSQEIAAMRENERQALWAGKMVQDPRIQLAWNRINLDGKAREELADEQDESWERVKQIECNAAHRLAESGEKGVTYVITSFGYERSRTCAPPPLEDRLALGMD